MPIWATRNRAGDCVADASRQKAKGMKGRRDEAETGRGKHRNHQSIHHPSPIGRAYTAGMHETRIQRVIDRVDALRHEVDDHWQVPAEEARLLGQLVRVGRCRSICEIGVSYGFSTLHLAAAAAEHGGQVHAFEQSEKKIEAAARHLSDAGLIESVALHGGDARQRLKTVEPEAPFDFVFFDAVKEQSRDYFEAVRDRLATRCVLATDNTDTHPEQIGPFIEHLRALPGARSTNVSVGNGFELTVFEA